MCSDNRLQFIYFVSTGFTGSFRSVVRAAIFSATRKVHAKEFAHNHKDISVECEFSMGDIWKFHSSVPLSFTIFFFFRRFEKAKTSEKGSQLKRSVD